MSGWNYRVMRSEQPGGPPWYAIHEVYYGAGGAVDGWAEKAATLGSETVDGLLSELAIVAEALTQPVLDEKTGASVEPERIFRDETMVILQAAKDAGRITFE